MLYPCLYIVRSFEKPPTNCMLKLCVCRQNYNRQLNCAVKILCIQIHAVYAQAYVATLLICKIVKVCSHIFNCHLTSLFIVAYTLLITAKVNFVIQIRLS